MKILLLTAIGAVTLLAMATAVLARYNWNQKLAGQLISVLVVGTATAFVTVLLSLRDVDERWDFSTSFAVDSADHLPPKPRAPEFSTRMMWRATDLARSSRPARGDGGTMRRVALPPADESKMHDYYAELLQYQIACDIRDMQVGSGSYLPVQIKSGIMVVTSRLRRAQELTGIARVWATDWNAAIRTNQFANSDEDDKWDEILVTVPEHVELQLSESSPSPDDPRRRRVIELFRDGYFHFTVVITWQAANTGGAIPNGFFIDDAVARRCETSYFDVTMHLQVDKLRSGGQLSETYQSWVRQIATALEARWSDVGNTASP